MLELAYRGTPHAESTACTQKPGAVFGLHSRAAGPLKSAEECGVCAGVVLAILAAIFTAFAFFAIGSIPKSESALVIAMWFHAAAALTAFFPLLVRAPRRLPQPLSCALDTATCPDGAHLARTCMAVAHACSEASHGYCC